MAAHGKGREGQDTTVDVDAPLGEFSKKVFFFSFSFFRPPEQPLNPALLPPSLPKLQSHPTPSRFCSSFNSKRAKAKLERKKGKAKGKNLLAHYSPFPFLNSL